MVSLFQFMLINGSVKELADSWRVTPEQAATRLRDLPFVVLSHEHPRGGSRGRPGRRLALDSGWRFWDKVGVRPFGELVAYLRTLHGYGEPFALGVPFTSALWRPFLHPEVRILAPPETCSIWVRLFGGGTGTLAVVIEPLPRSVEVSEVEGLPVLALPLAAVDALQGFGRVPNLNLLAFADWVAHHSPDLGRARQFAARLGLENDLSCLEDHRHRSGMRLITSDGAREAHRLAVEMSRVPPKTSFLELLEREAVTHD